MDTAPLAPADAPEPAQPAERPTIGFPSIPSRSAQEPVPVPSIPLATEPVGVDEPPGTDGLDPVEDRAAAVGPPPDPPSAPAGLTAVAVLPSPPDGEEAFPPGVRSRLKWYVYLLVDPRTGRPFSVGRGRDDQCFDHLRAARAGGDTTSFPALDRIRQIEASGRPVRIEILRYGLDPDESHLVEAVAHELLGLPGELAAGRQRRPVEDVRLLLTKRAKFKRSHQVVLLRVGPAGTDVGYDRARHGWRIGRRWIDVDGVRAPHWAVIVVGELVDSVYRLERWEGGGERGPDRYSFVGARDSELEARYVGKSVAPYLGKGSPGSVAYVWCGPHWVNTAQ